MRRGNLVRHRSAWKAGITLAAVVVVPFAALAGPGGTPRTEVGTLPVRLTTLPGSVRESVKALAPASLSATPVWSFESNLVGVDLGTSVATAGDVNGDGLSDILATAPGATSGTARVWLFLGSTSGTPTLAPGFPIGSLHGSPVAGPAGDLNGDGYGDIAIGLWEFLPTANGTFRVYYGNASGVNTGSPFIVAPVAVGGLGHSVGTAGDVNGDGYDDLIVGAPYVETALVCSGFNFGLARVYYGSATGLSASNVWELSGCTWVVDFGVLGYSVSTAGDVNADGYDDILVGAPGAGASGEVYVYFGSEAGLPTGPTDNPAFWPRQTLAGAPGGGAFGASVAPAGDVNGDGYADVLIGAPSTNLGPLVEPGVARIFRGGPSGVESEFWYEFGVSSYAHFGQSVAPAGDVNGDGLADVVVGMPGYDATPSGAEGAFVLCESHATTMIASTPVLGSALGGQTGTSVAAAGDVNGDGFGDVLVGTPGWTSGEIQEGQVSLYLGRGNPPRTTPQTLIQGYMFEMWAGHSLAGVGDVNGDGYDDFLVGLPGFDFFYVDQGLAFLYSGGEGGPGESYSWYGFGVPGGKLGSSMSGAGDVNGDGYDDFLIGSPEADGVGEVGLWYGGPSGPAFTANWLIVGTQPDAQYGVSVSGAGDVNGDGYADVLVGAPFHVNSLDGEGACFVYHGGPGGPDTSPDQVIYGGQADARLGWSVAGAGDVNRDGYADIVIGVPYWDRKINQFVSIADVGRAGVFLGGPSGVAGSAQVWVQGATSGYYMGASVAHAGDVNGDGYSDVAVGSPGATSGASGEGAVNVFPGSSTGVGSTSIFGVFGGEAGGRYGQAVASAGDVNGDGLSDLIVGAPEQDAGGATDQGKAYLYLGPLTSTIPAWQVSGGSQHANLGFAVGNLGDLNGDGWAELGAGAPRQDVLEGYDGEMRIYFGAKGYGRNRLSGIRRLTTHGIVPLGGLADADVVMSFDRSRSAAGRTRVRSEWRLESVNPGPPNVNGMESGWTRTEAPAGSLGSFLDRTRTHVPMDLGAQYLWRLRTRAHNPYFPTTPWYTPTRNARTEADFRTGSPTTGVAGVEMPNTPLILSAHPNPSRGPSILEYALPGPGRVRIEVLDVQGRVVRRLVDGERQAGRQVVAWDGTDESGAPTGTGVYFYRLEAGDLRDARKILRIR